MRKIEEEYMVAIRCRLEEINSVYFGYLSDYKNIVLKDLKEWGVKVLDHYMSDNGTYIIVTSHISELLKDYLSQCYKNDNHVIIKFIEINKK